MNSNKKDFGVFHRDFIKKSVFIRVYLWLILIYETLAKGDYVATRRFSSNIGKLVTPN
jgi:hypothetical protein